MGRRSGSRDRAVRLLAITAAVVAMGFVIWLDIRTGVWEEVVILSGIAAGLLTFLLTALFLDRILARSEHERWMPVTRLALTDLLHALIDDRSEISRGHIRPRRLVGSDGVDRGQVEDLLAEVMSERRQLTEAMARWSAFLAASADVQALMDHLARIAWHLDRVRDAGVAYERQGDQRSRSEWEQVLAEHDTEVEHAVAELVSLVRATATEPPR